MKVDMSPRAVENRLKLVGELTRTCLLLRQAVLKHRKTKESNAQQSNTEKFNPSTSFQYLDR